ncbi:hypothetical protein OK006_3068 [Actinobacteria bacterium OK006]|nr:hypothetical protein OK006_3068 [Actinobacteria bacterium OK006]
MEPVEELQVENAQLQEAMRSHTVVDQAISDRSHVADALRSTGYWLGFAALMSPSAD